MALNGAAGGEDSGSADWAPTSLGTSAAPATTNTISAAAAQNVLPAIWWTDYTINIDKVTVLASAAASTTLNFQVIKYTKNGGILGALNGNGSMYVYADFSPGELNNGDSITITGSDEAAYNQTWAIDKVHAGYGRFAIPIKFLSNPANKGSFTIN